MFAKNISLKFDIFQMAFDQSSIWKPTSVVIGQHTALMNPKSFGNYMKNTKQHYSGNKKIISPSPMFFLKSSYLENVTFTKFLSKR